MFQEIRIQGVGVIDDALLELSPGLNVITGETGAGKTMVVSGLGLLLGARGDSGLVRAGHGAARVEGVVELPSGHPALTRAAQAGADVDDGLVLVRTVSAEGRSRAHVGGTSTPLGVLTELGELLVAVHGQADQWRLRQGDQHRELLDAFGGPSVGAALAAYQECFDALGNVTRVRDRLRGLARDRARELDALTTGLERIEAADPLPGEDVALRAEEERLAHADGLRTAVARAHRALSGDDEDAGTMPNGVTETLAAARAALAPEADHDPAVEELGRRVAELGYLAADVAADLSSYLADIEADPLRLAAVQERRAALGGLVRLYGAPGDTVDDVLRWGQGAASRVAELLGADDRVEELEEQADGLRSELGRLAAGLTSARRAAAGELGAKVTDELGHLAMPRATVRVCVTVRPDVDGVEVDGQRLRATRSGVDEVEIQLQSGSSQAPRSVTKVASGEKLSRVMLAIEVVSNAGTGMPGAGSAALPTFVFDEVDAGVGGRAALDVGARLARLAQHAQVVVVTHLAQVAAFADRHLVVRRSDEGRVTSSDVVAVTGDERLQELSRMMSGDLGSAAGLEHARQLLEQATSTRLGATPTRRGATSTGRRASSAGRRAPER